MTIEAGGVPGQYERFGYRRSRRSHLPALLIVTALHAALLFLVLSQREPVRVQHARALTVFDVDLQPPPPPPDPVKPPPSPELRPERIERPSPIVAPPAVVPLSSPVVTSPEPAAPPAPAKPAPAPAPAPSAPPAEPVAANDLAGTMISAVPPRYPIDSRRKREQGVVVLRLLVGEDGRVEDIAVSRSSGHDRLDKAALSAVRNWRWSPRKSAGASVKVRGLVEIPFVLRD